MSPVVLHLTIRGTVQGVGYRWSLVREARRLAVAGWCRNRADGSVEAMAAGEAAAVEALVAWCRHGPPGAAVSAVEVEDGSGRFDGFEQHPTL